MLFAADTVYRIWLLQRQPVRGGVPLPVYYNAVQWPLSAFPARPQQIGNTGSLSLPAAPLVMAALWENLEKSVSGQQAWQLLAANV